MKVPALRRGNLKPLVETAAGRDLNESPRPKAGKLQGGEYRVGGLAATSMKVPALRRGNQGAPQ